MKTILCLLSIILISTLSCINESSQLKNSEYRHLITEENLVLENEYKEMLKPIISLKSKEPKVYWFIVSWLKTQYRTPNWKNYNSVDWKKKTKLRGIDCSGFARVMQQEIYNKKIRGSSRGILKNYCTPKVLEDLEMGDLVFFKAPYSKNKRIVHVGVYLMDTYFVHATSGRSAAKGLGLNISSLSKKRWKREFVSGGTVIKK